MYLLAKHPYRLAGNKQSVIFRVVEPGFNDNNVTCFRMTSKKRYHAKTDKLQNRFHAKTDVSDKTRVKKKRVVEPGLY